MRSREEVLREFGLALCDKGDTCTHYDCTGERRMADRILELEAQQTAGEPVAWLHVAVPPKTWRAITTDPAGAAPSDYWTVTPLYAHPRPRVGVTEAMKEAGAKQMYEGPESVLGVWRNASEQTKEHYRALAKGCLTAALALADSPAPPANGGGEVARG